MQRTTVTLGEPLLRDLHRMAEERRTSVSAIIREAVEEKLSTFRPKPKSLGIAASG
ncbi:MAG: ribbon-helix-helix protein, CopG family [Dehalococcoidia bacterium]|nr:ribbon-helix-helix protein, CopG family [Dehalococcoidia bacterium]